MKRRAWASRTEHWVCPLPSEATSKLFNNAEEANCGPELRAVGPVARVLGRDVLLTQREVLGSSARTVEQEALQPCSTPGSDPWARPSRPGH